MFICGSGSFGREDDNEPNSSPNPNLTPKRSKRSTSFCRILGKDGGANKNPYADRGLDKFYALLADLDHKKQKIYTQMGSEDVSFVRFVYADDSNQVKPIVVRVKDKKQLEKGHVNSIKQSLNTAANDQACGANRAEEAPPKGEPHENKSNKKKRCLVCHGSFKLEDLRQPYFCFLAMVVLIMVLVVVFGRSFAILCTSIGWYLAPSVVGESSSSSSSGNERKPKRKEYARKRSDKKINVQNEGPSSPTSVIDGLTDNNKTQKR